MEEDIGRMGRGEDAAFFAEPEQAPAERSAVPQGPGREGVGGIFVPAGEGEEEGPQEKTQSAEEGKPVEEARGRGGPVEAEGGQKIRPREEEIKPEKGGPALHHSEEEGGRDMPFPEMPDLMGEHGLDLLVLELGEQGVEEHDAAPPAETGEEGIGMPRPAARIHHLELGRRKAEPAAGGEKPLAQRPCGQRRKAIEQGREEERHQEDQGELKEEPEPEEKAQGRSQGETMPEKKRSGKKREAEEGGKEESQALVAQEEGPGLGIEALAAFEDEGFEAGEGELKKEEEEEEEEQKDEVGEKEGGGKEKGGEGSVEEGQKAGEQKKAPQKGGGEAVEEGEAVSLQGIGPGPFIHERGRKGRSRKGEGAPKVPALKEEKGGFKAVFQNE